MKQKQDPEIPKPTFQQTQVMPMYRIEWRAKYAPMIVDGEPLGTTWQRLKDGMPSGAKDAGELLTNCYRKNVALAIIYNAAAQVMHTEFRLIPYDCKISVECVIKGEPENVVTFD